MSTLGASSDESESANAADMPGFGDLDIFFFDLQEFFVFFQIGLCLIRFNCLKYTFCRSMSVECMLSG